MASSVVESTPKRFEFLTDGLQQSKVPKAEPQTQIGLHLKQVMHRIEKQLTKQYPTTDVTGLSDLIVELGVGGKIIATTLSRSSILGVLGYTGESNVQGEAVKYMDELSNKVMLQRLLESGLIASIVTEEEENVKLPDNEYSGQFCIAIDPLDGSSNIDCDVNVGSIFGIHVRKSARHTQANESDYLRPGRDLVCAGYILYGPSTLMVIAVPHHVVIFTYDPTIGEFILTNEDVRIPDGCKYYSVNEGNWSYWQQADRELIEYYKSINKSDHRPIAARYVGSLVADFHRGLCYSGIYLYPKDNKDKKLSNGKLRYMYECSPLSFIAEQAGGMGATEDENMLDYMPKNVHDRVPLYVGNKKDVETAMAFHKRN